MGKLTRHEEHTGTVVQKTGQHTDQVRTNKHPKIY